MKTTIIKSPLHWKNTVLKLWRFLQTQKHKLSKTTSPSNNYLLVSLSIYTSALPLWLVFLLLNLSVVEHIFFLLDNTLSTMFDRFIASYWIVYMNITDIPSHKGANSFTMNVAKIQIYLTSRTFVQIRAYLPLLN